MKYTPNWNLKFWRLPQLDNLELLHASQITHDYPPHIHEEYSVGLILRGAEITTCRGVRHEARAGDLLLINAEEVHSNKSIDSEYRVIKIRRDTLRKIGRQLESGSIGEPHFPELIVNGSRSFRRLLNLHLKLEQNVSALEQESDFVSAIACLLVRHGNQQFSATKRKSGSSRNENMHVRKIRDYLRAHHAENVSLSELASLTNLSPYYLLRIFHSGIGFPPHEYQTQVRIAHARRLIRSGTPLSQVALETGFFDQSHLSRNFKRIVGLRLINISTATTARLL